MVWGPNENFNQISSSAFNFLYEQLESSEILGDINFDNIVDILDIILVINYILINDYSDSADINSDLAVDILDIVAILNILLEN